MVEKRAVSEHDGCYALAFVVSVAPSGSIMHIVSLIVARGREGVMQTVLISKNMHDIFE